MKIMLLFLFVISSIISSAQVKLWITDYDKAKDLSKESGKLMVIDFWADWCKPCQEMDKKLWNNAEVRVNSQNFVAVKIDVMKDKFTPEKFGVTGIPKVVIAMSDGTILWERTGFYSANDFANVLNSIPDDVSKLYKCFYSIYTKSKDSKCAFDIAIEFQKLAMNTNNKELKNSFIRFDAEYFKKAKKFNNAPEIIKDIDLYLLINDIYKGNAEKALKEFSKIYKSADDCANPCLAHFIVASCYKEMNDIEKYEKEISMIRNEEFLAQLKSKQ
jgi:thiol-disulfide isomerase/thioredoxin